MNYIRSGTFKSGTATNVDQGVSASVAGLDASLAFYQGTEGDYTLNGTARSEVFAYYLKVGSNAGYRFDGVLVINAGGGNDLVDLTNSANPYPHDVTVDGGAGNDTIWSGPGADELIGGAD
ncbi:MAG: hypothetical protein P9F75_21830, partial [Candidatus Contendobacter sp.]|nr:hypothetical protein [Candidatus Contendobacter sp.]